MIEKKLVCRNRGRDQNSIGRSEWNQFSTGPVWFATGWSTFWSSYQKVAEPQPEFRFRSDRIPFRLPVSFFLLTFVHLWCDEEIEDTAIFIGLLPVCCICKFSLLLSSSPLKFYLSLPHLCSEEEGRRKKLPKEIYNSHSRQRQEGAQFFHFRKFFFIFQIK